MAFDDMAFDDNDMAFEGGDGHDIAPENQPGLGEYEREHDEVEGAEEGTNDGEWRVERDEEGRARSGT